MKKLYIIVLTTLLFSTTSVAKPKRFYADVQVTNIIPSESFIWQRKNQNTPKYPIELALDGVVGCALLSFDINESGRTQNVEVMRSMPKKKLGKYARKMLKKWKWQAIDPNKSGAVSKRVIRLDFCMGGESTEQAQQFCRQQAKLDCQAT